MYKKIAREGVLSGETAMHEFIVSHLAQWHNQLAILIASVIGISVALEQFVLAVGVTIFCLFVLPVVKKLQDRVANSEEKEQ